MRLLEQTPDLGHCWVRYTFRPWAGSSDLWLDLFSRGLGKGLGSESGPDDLPSTEGLDDVVYLPPFDGSREAIKAALAEQLAATQTPVLAQCIPGAKSGSPGAVDVYDVLQAIATEDLQRLDEVPSGAAVIWPLISGYTDDEEKWDMGLGRLADVGVGCVHGIVADLSPADRRRMVDVAGEQGFEKLFHGPVPAERDFARAVHRFGMQPFLERPLPLTPTRLVNNRRLAGLLASIGELWLRLGRAEPRGQAFYRAARWIDRDNHDLLILAREGNLGVVDWLDDESRRVILEIAARDESSLLADLRLEYLEATTPR